MAQASQLNWAAIDADPRFQRAARARRLAFLMGLMIFSIVYYFLLPIGAAYFTDLFRKQDLRAGEFRHPVRAVRVRRRLGHRLLSTRRRANGVRRDGAANSIRDAEKIGRK
ncbi:MAG: hypothetical protein MZW92_11290 [Comamonadaceae bacterium]|nr:hypothetical protein [Comamonadaceae bacterium]